MRTQINMLRNILNNIDFDLEQLEHKLEKSFSSDCGYSCLPENSELRKDLLFLIQYCHDLDVTPLVRNLEEAIISLGNGIDGYHVMHEFSRKDSKQEE